MDKYLMLQELSAQVTGSQCDRASECPDELAYWSFWDDDDTSLAVKEHFRTCQYCKSELVRVGMAMLMAPEPNISAASRVLSALQRPLAEAKVILESIRGNLVQVFNPLEVIPVYRSSSQKALVLAAGDQYAQVEIEVITNDKDDYSIYVAVKKCRSRDGIGITIGRNGDLLRSVSLLLGERAPIGTWAKGIYLLSLSLRGKEFYHIELDLR